MCLIICFKSTEPLKCAFLRRVTYKVDIGSHRKKVMEVEFGIRLVSSVIHSYLALISFLFQVGNLHDHVINFKYVPLFKSISYNVYFLPQSRPRYRWILQLSARDYYFPRICSATLVRPDRGIRRRLG